LIWDPTYLDLAGVDTSGAGYDFQVDFFPHPLNDNLHDGDAYLTALAQPGEEASVPSGGLVVTTLLFQALQATGADGTAVSFLPSAGSAQTQVRTLPPIIDVTGDISATGDVFIVSSGGGCTCQNARSCKDHAGTEHCITLGCNGGIEPRLGGVEKIELDIDDASNFGAVAAVLCEYSGDVTTSVASATASGNTVTVEFDPTLPDQDACTIELNCGASMCVRTCEGDMNQTGSTTTADSLQVKIRFLHLVDETNAMWDFNVSNSITTADSLQVKIRFGFAAPETCPWSCADME
jgi:hypothetical protein